MASPSARQASCQPHHIQRSAQTSPYGTKVDFMKQSSDALTRPGTGQLVKNKVSSELACLQSSLNISGLLASPTGLGKGGVQGSSIIPGQPNAANPAAAPLSNLDLAWMTYELSRGGNTPSGPSSRFSQSGSSTRLCPGEALGGDSSNPSSVGTGGAAGSLGQGTPPSERMYCSRVITELAAPKGSRGKLGNYNEQQTERADHTGGGDVFWLFRGRGK